MQLVETVAVCLARIADSVGSSSNLLDELCKLGLIQKSLELITNDGHRTLSRVTYSVCYFNDFVFIIWSFAMFLDLYTFLGCLSLLLLFPHSGFNCSSHQTCWKFSASSSDPIWAQYKQNSEEHLSRFWNVRWFCLCIYWGFANQSGFYPLLW